MMLQKRSSMPYLKIIGQFSSFRQRSRFRPTLTYIEMNLMEGIFLRAVDYSNCSNNLRKWEKNQRSFAPTCKTFLICVTHGLRDCFISRKSLP